MTEANAIYHVIRSHNIDTDEKTLFVSMINEYGNWVHGLYPLKGANQELDTENPIFFHDLTSGDFWEGKLRKNEDNNWVTNLDPLGNIQSLTARIINHARGKLFGGKDVATGLYIGNIDEVGTDEGKGYDTTLSWVENIHNLYEDIRGDDFNLDTQLDINQRFFKQTIFGDMTAIKVRDNIWNGTYESWSPFEDEIEEEDDDEANVLFRTEHDAVIIRPNGERYYPRMIDGHVDVALLRSFRAANMYAQLYGLPGAGKNAVAEAAFGEELITVNGHNDFHASHFVGSYIANQSKKDASDSDWIWVDGPLTRAMKEGRPILVDEATRIPSGSLDVLLSATDGRRLLTLDDLPNAPTIVAKEGFYVMISYNPETLNGRRLDDALLSRFGLSIKVETDYDALDELEIPESAINIAKRLATADKTDRDAGGRGSWKPQMRELLTFKRIVDQNLGVNFAAKNLFTQAPTSIHAELSNIINNEIGMIPSAIELGKMASPMLATKE